MKLPKLDILLPTLFVGVIFPLGAGGWWRYFSGYADQVGTSVTQVQSSSSSAAQFTNAPGVIVARPHSGTKSVGIRQAVHVQPSSTQFGGWPAMDDAAADLSFDYDGWSN